MYGSTRTQCRCAIMAASLSYNNWLKYKNVLDAFTSSGISVAHFLRDIIQFSGEFEAEHAVLINEVLDNAGNLFLAFIQHPRSSHASTNWATTFSTHILKGELLRLSDASMGMHFNALHARARQITDFTSGPLITRISQCAPHLWSFMQSMLVPGSSTVFTGNERDFEEKKRVFDVVCINYMRNRVWIAQI